MSSQPKKVAVLLCGSGYRDGSEIRESVAALWALDKHGAEVSMFAPDGEAYDVVNCLTGQTVPGEKRQMRVEAARIARGQVESISKLKPSDFDALVIPGGFGVAKNFCDFALKGSAGSVRPDVQKVIEQFHSERKPIGAICIAPALVGLTLKNTPLTLTLGQASEAVDEIRKLGHQVELRPSSEWVVDEKNRLVTTPAYMDDQAPIAEVFTGIEGLVQKVLALA
jgi:enhancing lycopene biosynthesis protein 2